MHSQRSASEVADLKIQECFLQGVVQERSGFFIYTVL